MLHHDRETAKLLVRERHEALRQDALAPRPAPPTAVESRGRRRRLAFRRLWVGLRPARHAS
jgi:hypothetical protein